MDPSNQISGGDAMVNDRSMVSMSGVSTKTGGATTGKTDTKKPKVKQETTSTPAAPASQPGQQNQFGQTVVNGMITHDAMGNPLARPVPVGDDVGAFRRPEQASTPDQRSRKGKSRSKDRAIDVNQGQADPMGSMDGNTKRMFDQIEGQANFLLGKSNGENIPSVISTLRRKFGSSAVDAFIDNATSDDYKQDALFKDIYEGSSSFRRRQREEGRDPRESGRRKAEKRFTDGAKIAANSETDSINKTMDYLVDSGYLSPGDVAPAPSTSDGTMQPPKPQPSTTPTMLQRPSDAAASAPAQRGTSVSDVIDEVLRDRNLQPKIPSGFTDVPQPDPSRATGAPIQVAPSMKGGDPAPMLLRDQQSPEPEPSLQDLLARDAQRPPLPRGFTETPPAEDPMAGILASGLDGVESLTDFGPTPPSAPLTPSERLGLRETTREEFEQGRTRLAPGAVGSAPQQPGGPATGAEGYQYEIDGGMFVPSDAAKSAANAVLGLGAAGAGSKLGMSLNERLRAGQASDNIPVNLGTRGKFDENIRQPLNDILDELLLRLGYNRE